MATPYLDEAERCSRVALMSEGRLLALDDPPGELRRSFLDEVVEILARRRRHGRLDVVAPTPVVRDVQTFGERLHARVAGAPATPSWRASPARCRRGRQPLGRAGRSRRRSRTCSSIA
jgi:ABC-type multidrug transport system ATPase subunit